MSKKKGKHNVIQDFTINDCANAPKPVRTIRKSATDTVLDISWEELQDDCDIIEEINEDGTKNFVYKKKKSSALPIGDRPGQVYPEIIWYEIAKHINPEDIGNFARLNKATYAVTKQKSFWLRFYKKYCENHPNLPERLYTDSYKAYGLRQTVIRSMYYTYDVFTKRATRQMSQENRAHLLINRRCVTVWFKKTLTYWHVFFKLKKQKELSCVNVVDVIDEMGKIDANIEEDTQVLEVMCQSFQEVPPVMGMTLSSVSMVLSQGLRHYKLHLGFHSSRYSTKELVPECSVVLDAVVVALVFDWWLPQYPHSAHLVPKAKRLLKGDFFDDDKEEMRVGSD